jgi:ubiquitin carboxyl-terminal hydrolase 48
MKPKASTSTSSGQTVSNFYGKISGTRTSARTANKAGILNRKQMKSIEMEKHDKVKDLKLKVSSNSPDLRFLIFYSNFERDIQIEVATGIAIISQRVFFNMQELEGSQTVQELGLVGDDTIEVFEVVMDEDLDFNDLQDVDPDQVDRRGNLKRGAGGKKRAREEGFGGTGLTGWDRGQDEEGGGDGSGAGTPAEDEASGSSRGDKRSRSNSQAVSTAMQVDAAKERQISCPGCTFLNDPFLVECEICQTPLGG